MRGADLSLVLVGFSFTVANGFVPLQKKNEIMLNRNICNIDDLLLVLWIRKAT